MRVSRGEFTRMVQEAYKELPPHIKESLKNVDVEVVPWPASSQLDESGSRSRYGLLGLYSGVPLPLRGSEEPLLPDKITLFQRPIEMACRTHLEMVREVRVTLLHEVGHYLGMSEEDLHRRGYG